MTNPVTMGTRWRRYRWKTLLVTCVLGLIFTCLNLQFCSLLSLSSPLVPRSSFDLDLARDESSWREPPSEADLERQRRVAVFSRIFSKQRRRRMGSKGGRQPLCIHPKLDLKHDINSFAFYTLPPLNCTGSGMFISRHGMVVANISVEHQASYGKCSFYGIERLNDEAYSYADPVVKESPPFEVSLPHDFVRIRCVLKVTLEEMQNQRKRESLYNAGFHQDENHEDSQRELDEENRFDDVINDERKKLMRDWKNHAGKDDIGEWKNEREKNMIEDLSPDDQYNGDKAKWKAVLRHFEDQQKADEDNGDPEERALKGTEELGYSWDHNFAGEDLEDFDSMIVNPEMEESDFDQFLVQIHPKPDVFRRIADIKTKFHPPEPKMNVLMLALDSMSHLSYQRKLPATYKYLKEKLGAAIFENYNIVGDATTAAIIPMLTGKTEMELPEVRASQFDSRMVDEYPLVWNEFKNQGYATLFAEDEPSIATFNLRLNGFQYPPTDHYMRPFWQALWFSSLREMSERFCTGDIAHHRFMLHYLEDFFHQYRNVSKFAFGFHVELSHGDNNPTEYLDLELRAFFERLGQGGLLDNTMLVVFGDHGSRYSKVRNTVQGKLEERLPLMSLVFPHKFRQQFPQLYRNLHANTDRLATPFDIHETLLDIVNLSRTGDPALPGARGISLLREIPQNRTCKDADIAMHWCSCLHQVAVETDEAYVSPVSEALMSYLNNQVSEHRNHCAQLHLKKIHSAHIILPNEQVLKFLESQDSDQRLANLSGQMDLDVVHYQLQIETEPCGALYEATVMADFRDHRGYEFKVTPGISRINLYGKQPQCVQNKNPMLRKFCCCHDFVKENSKS